MLLVKRDKIKLIETKGEAKSVPPALKIPLTSSPEGVRQAQTYMLNLVDCKFSPSTKCNSRTLAKQALQNTTPHGPVWSGYRSALISLDGEWYKLKGIAARLHNPLVLNVEWPIVRVSGALTRRNALFEAEYLEMWNAVAQKEGIPIVMEPCGRWEYEAHAHGQRLVASVNKIKGDTRLDELLFTMAHTTRKGWRSSGELLHRIGEHAGYTLRMMHNHGFVWSESAGNAHSGNVVLCPGKNIEVGLVDFDDTTRYKERASTGLKSQELLQLISYYSGPFGTARHLKGHPWTRKTWDTFRIADTGGKAEYLWGKVQSGLNKGYMGEKPKCIPMNLFEEALAEIGIPPNNLYK